MSACTGAIGTSVPSGTAGALGTAPLWDGPGTSATAVPDDAERRARAALSALVEPGRWDLHDAVSCFGAVAVAEALSSGRRVGRVTAAVAAAAGRRAPGVVPQRDLDALARVGGRLLCPGDREWPAAALDWERGSTECAPPLALQVRGPHDLAAAADRAVAVVGARACTPYGQHVAHGLACELADRGCAVVSGLAHGIDAAAHRGALLAAGRAGAAPTVAVLGCGVDEAYPRDHERLLAEVAEQGLVVSEVVCGTRPTRARFLVRNRLIAALSAGTVVVEATDRSGSRSTAGRAADLGREVLAVPGPVTSEASRYPHQLLREGATLVTCADEVLEALSRPGEHLAPVRPVPPSVRDGLDRDTRAVLDALPVSGTGAGEALVAERAGVDPGLARRVLPPLQMAGLVERGPQGWRLTALGAGR